MKSCITSSSGEAVTQTKRQKLRDTNKRRMQVNDKGHEWQMKFKEHQESRSTSWRDKQIKEGIPLQEPFDSHRISRWRRLLVIWLRDSSRETTDTIQMSSGQDMSIPLTFSCFSSKQRKVTMITEKRKQRSLSCLILSHLFLLLMMAIMISAVPVTTPVATPVTTPVATESRNSTVTFSVPSFRGSSSNSSITPLLEYLQRSESSVSTTASKPISSERRAGGIKNARSEGKKKVVIIGEMSDLAFEMATNASASTNYALDDVTFADHDYDHFDDRPLPMNQRYPHPPYDRDHHHFHRLPPHYSRYYPYPSASSSSSRLRGKGGYSRPKSQYVTKKTLVSPASSSPSGSVFVPVAAYSVTHSRVGPNGVRRMRPGKSLTTLHDIFHAWLTFVTQIENMHE